MRSVVQAELGRLLDEYEGADRDLKAAPADVAASAARERAAARFWEAGNDLGDLFFLLLKHAFQREPEKMRVWMFTIAEGRLRELVNDAARAELVALNAKLVQLRNLYDNLKQQVKELTAASAATKREPAKPRY